MRTDRQAHGQMSERAGAEVRRDDRDLQPGIAVARVPRDWLSKESETVRALGGRRHPERQREGEEADDEQRTDGAFHGRILAGPVSASGEPRDLGDP